MKRHNIYILIISLISLNVIGQKSNLIVFLPSTCDLNEDVLRIRERISEMYLKHDTLVINVGFVANCGYSESPITGGAIFENDTLYLTYGFKHNFMDTIVENGDTVVYVSMNYAECDCCFEFMYLLREIPSTDIPIKLNDRTIFFHLEKYLTYPVEFEKLDGDTINYIDKYGFRQGKWLQKDTNGLVILDRYYRNDTIARGTDYRYYENGVLKTMLDWINNEHNDYYEYDMEGKILVHKKSPFDE